jgi:cytochrome c-type biogenesis protein CcmH/NrfG
VANFWLAYVHLESDHPTAALPFAEKAVELDPTVAQAWWNLGRARRGTGDLDGAIAAFQEGLKRDPKHAGCQSGLANALKARAARDRVAPPPREVKRP